MFIKEKKILSEIAAKLSSEPLVLQIIAFGSRIRGDFKGDSDFDVLVIVGNKTISVRNTIIETFYYYEMEYDVPFSVTILSIEEYEFNDKLGSPFIRSIKEEGVIIYDAIQRREGVSVKAQA